MRLMKLESMIWICLKAACTYQRPEYVYFTCGNFEMGNTHLFHSRSRLHPSNFAKNLRIPNFLQSAGNLSTTTNLIYSQNFLIHHIVSNLMSAIFQYWYQAEDTDTFGKTYIRNMVVRKHQFGNITWILETWMKINNFKFKFWMHIIKISPHWIVLIHSFSRSSKSSVWQGHHHFTFFVKLNFNPNDLKWSIFKVVW